MTFRKTLTLMTTILNNLILENDIKYTIIGEDKERRIFLNEHGFYEIEDDKIKYVPITLVMYIILILIYSRRSNNQYVEDAIINNTYVNDPKEILTDQKNNFKSYIDAYYKLNLNNSNIINIKDNEQITIAKRIKACEKIRIIALASFERKVLDLYIRTKFYQKVFSFEDFLLDMIDESYNDVCDQEEIINKKNTLFK